MIPVALIPIMETLMHCYTIALICYIISLFLDRLKTPCCYRTAYAFSRLECSIPLSLQPKFSLKFDSGMYFLVSIQINKITNFNGLTGEIKFMVLRFQAFLHYNKSPILPLVTRSAYKCSINRPSFLSFVNLCRFKLQLANHME